MSSSENDSALVAYIKRRRAISRRAAAKSRAQLKERAARVQQTYYEAKSSNTQLIYRYKQLERVRDTLEAAWAAHKRLHNDAGIHVSEVVNRQLQTYDVSSSVSLPASIRELSRGQSVIASPLLSPQSDAAGLSSRWRYLSEPSTTTRQADLCSHGHDLGSLQRRAGSDPTAITVQGRPSSRGQTFRGVQHEPPNYAEFSHFGNDEENCDVLACDQPQQPSWSTSLLCFTGQTGKYVPQLSSAVVDEQDRSVDQSISPANDDEDDDDDLASLFGDDCWSSDQSWKWQCGLLASSVDEAGQTPVEIGTMADGLSPAWPTSGICRSHATSIPLHVECLIDDSCSQCPLQDTSDI